MKLILKKVIGFFVTKFNSNFTLQLMNAKNVIDIIDEFYIKIFLFIELYIYYSEIVV